MKKLLNLSIVICAIILTACNTVNKITVTLVEAEDAVMKEWARLHNDRKTTADIDSRVMEAHDKFNQAKLTAAIYLKAYVAGADKEDYIYALEALRETIGPLIDLISPMLPKTRVEALKSTTAAASSIGN